VAKRARTHEEVKELVEAAKQDFIDGNETYAVLRARLSSLLPKDEVTYEVNRAVMQRRVPIDARYVKSVDWLLKYYLGNKT
jgi:hypothetical protein